MGKRPHLQLLQVWSEMACGFYGPLYELYSTEY